MRASSLLAGPLWGLQLFTGAKSFEFNPLIGSPVLNRWGLHAARVAFAYRLAEGRRAKLASRLSPEHRTSFDRDGFVVCRDFLDESTFRVLVDEVARFRGPIRQKTEGATVLRKIAVDPAIRDAIPSLRAVDASNLWQSLCRYAGARDVPPRLFIQGVQQHAADGDRDPQTLLHADTFHPTVKAWLFLTDVERDRGAFTYVRGSHLLTPGRLAWERRTSLSARSSDDFETRQGSFRIDESELPGLGFGPPEQVVVPANTLVVADTFGFHARGPSLGPSSRVEIWGLGPRNPFLPGRHLDGLVGALGATGRSGDIWDQVSGISIFDAAI